MVSVICVFPDSGSTTNQASCFRPGEMESGPALKMAWDRVCYLLSCTQLSPTPHNEVLSWTWTRGLERCSPV